MNEIAFTVALVISSLIPMVMFWGGFLRCNRIKVVPGSYPSKLRIDLLMGGIALSVIFLASVGKLLILLTKL